MIPFATNMLHTVLTNLEIPADTEITALKLGDQSTCVCVGMNINEFVQLLKDKLDIQIDFEVSGDLQTLKYFGYVLEVRKTKEKETEVYFKLPVHTDAKASLRETVHRVMEFFETPCFLGNESMTLEKVTFPVYGDNTKIDDAFKRIVLCGGAFTEIGIKLNRVSFGLFDLIVDRNNFTISVCI